MKVCSEPGCPNVTSRGRCNPCRIQADRRRPSATRRGYDRSWRRTRRAHLRLHPICEDCGEAPAVQVHHMDGLGPKGPRGHDPSNLRGLCGPCHSKRTADEQPGGWNV